MTHEDLMATHVNDNVAELVSELLKELASELDLHYEDEDFFALAPSIEVMKRGADYLDSVGHPIPPACQHVMRRYQRHCN